MPFSNRDDFAKMQAVPRDVPPNPAFAGGSESAIITIERHVYWKADSGDHADIARSLSVAYTVNAPRIFVHLLAAGCGTQRPCQWSPTMSVVEGRPAAPSRYRNFSV